MTDGVLNSLFYTTMVLFLIVCSLLILVVLVQKGRGGGLAGAFGGAGGNTAFGSKTGDVLTWATSVIFGVFLVLAVALNHLANERNFRATGAIAPTPIVQQSTTPVPTPAPTTPPPAPTPQATPTSTPSTQPQ